MKKTVNCASIGVNLPEDMARDVDAMFAGLPLECKSYHRKALIADQITFEPGERAEVSVITTSSVDKTDEVVLPSGVNYDIYRRNPVVLWNHRQDLPTVAVCTWIKNYNDSIRAKSTYPEREDPDPDRPWYIDQVWDMVKAGILRAKSIGFLPQTPKREPTADELLTHPEWAGSGVWDDVVMVEYSCCTVGVNNDALVEAVNTKSFDPVRLLEIGLQVAAQEVEQAAAPEETPKVLSVIQKAILEPSVQEKVAALIAQGHEPDKAAVIAVATLHAKSMKPRQRIIKKANPDKVLAQVIDKIRIRPQEIVRVALESYRNRGRI